MSTPEPTTVGGRYQLAELLGRGGMAEVRKGVDTRLGRTVAVKRLRTDLASDATFQARFRREAQSSASLNHPAIVSVYDTGEEWVENSEGGVAQPYIVMEYVAGRTLRDVLREGRKILPERALEITSGILTALDYSHRAGIIHRDIKPGNVMLTPTGDVKVMDFGIARAVSDASSTMTQTAAVVGTAQYLSPEQARGETVDSRSDVYSTGCVLYELLTGRPPFVGDSPVSVAYQHVREPVVPPTEVDPELPPEVDTIVLKALAKRVDDRYQSAAAMRQDIERLLAGQPVQGTPPASRPSTSTPVAATGVTRAVPDANPDEAHDRKARNGLAILIGLLVTAVVVLALFVLPRMFDSASDEVRVPDLLGLTEAEARAEIGKADLRVGPIDYEASDEFEADSVMRQDPTGTYVARGSTVTFVISTGPPQVEVPNLAGQTKDAATEVLKARNLKVKVKTEKSDRTKDEVVRTEPAAFQEVSEGTVVTIFVSQGPATVPDVVGKNEAEARKLIEEAGFSVSVVESGATEAPKGTVVQQSPTSQPLAQGTVVTLVVSTFEPPAPSETDSPEGEQPGLPDGETPPDSGGAG